MFHDATDPPTYPVMPLAPGADRVNDRQTAAVLVWVSGAVCIALFGLCSLTLVALVAWQPPEVISQLPAEQVDQILMGLPIVSACMVVFFVLPGVALVVLGFAVRAGKRGPTVAAGVILWALAGLLSVWVVLNITVGLWSGDVLGVLVNLVVFGAVIALLIASAWHLHRVGPGQRQDMTDEPWNSHLMG